MKRQRNNADSGSSKAAAATKLEDEKLSKKVTKKSPGGADDVGEEIPVMEENLRRVGWKELPWLSGGVDEQMSWGSFWLPSWDVEFVDKAYNIMFSDVAWDDDIWNLKNVHDIPNQ